MSPTDLERWRQDEEDLRWFAEHAEDIERQYRGKYIAIVNKQLFVGESFEEVETLARSACPERDPIVERVPFKGQLLVV